MSGKAPVSVGMLLKLAGWATLMAAMGSLARSKSFKAPRAMPVSLRSSRSGLRAEVSTYIVGYGLALGLTILAFAVVHWHWVSFPNALWLVFALALVQIIVHFRCFLHVTLGESARDDLQLILFSTLIVLLMVGGTLVVLFNLRMRMM